MKIHDRCHRLGCRWFVVTTYNTWAFGVFSKGWTSAFITRPKPYCSVAPTILQCLVYWIQSSMDCSGKWDIDEVSVGVRPPSHYDISSRKRGVEDEDLVVPTKTRRRSSYALPSRVCSVSDFAFTDETAALAVALAR
ncbi:hypothetical protein BS47DRAFT_1286640 [Hydnum rufescens UP504]|uniref:Uncharacterized protein n=1 Tax=Hydnum rufescens UP504 TaxID=1448309 RepID=A0A9P6BAN8_9AGAM|nr:hypothetical protein BS47DRAFT_1286640 [Hydnum rufescens UP504]